MILHDRSYFIISQRKLLEVLELLYIAQIAEIVTIPDQSLIVKERRSWTAGYNKVYFINGFMRKIEGKRFEGCWTV